MRALPLVLLIAGCAAAAHGGGSDLGQQNGICPAHPDQCGGKCCGASCIDVMSFDRTNCGDCGVTCPAGQVCAAGSCGCPAGGNTSTTCSNSQSCCGSLGCKSLMSDDFHCGDCMTACSGGAHCSGGKCLCGGVQCMGAQVCCGGACSSTCATPDMATPPGDMAGQSGQCQCANMCTPGSKFCVGPDCCFEQAFFNLCVPSTTCTPQMYP